MTAARQRSEYPGPMADFDAATRFAQALRQHTTVGLNGAPHLVPVVFAVHADVVYTAVDAKRKSTQRLRRLANITGNPHVPARPPLRRRLDAVVVVRADGVATIHQSGEEMATGYALLRSKYVQYQRIALDGPVVTVAVQRWSSWQA